MPYLNLETFLELILPKLFGMTLRAIVAASAVGALVGWIATVTYRRIQHRRKIEITQSTRSLILPAIYGAFIGLMLGMLIYEANATSLEGGMLSGLVYFMAYILIIPIGSFTGALMGIAADFKLPSQLKQPKAAITGIVITYILSSSILYIGLAPSPLKFTTPESNKPFPVIARISRYKELPSSLSLSSDGELLGVITYARGTGNIDIWNLSDKAFIHRYQIPLNGDSAFKVGLTSLGFSDNGQELMTASPSQVEIRRSASHQVRLRLQGGFIALPMAGERLVTLSVVDTWSHEFQHNPHDLKIWDLDSGRLLQTISADLTTGHRNEVLIAVSPDRQLIAFPHKKSKQIEVWNIATGKQISAFGEKVVSGGPRALTFSPNGRQLAVSSDTTKPLQIWDWQQRKLVNTLPEIANAYQLHWIELGIIAQYEGRFDLFNPQTGTIAKTMLANDSETSGLLYTSGLSTMSEDAKVLAIYTKEGITAWQVG